MGKGFAALLLCLMVIAVAPMVQGSRESPQEVEKWIQNLSNMKEKLTKLHFYFHDIVSGKTPTAVPVAQVNITTHSPTFFGLISVMDDALTVDLEPNPIVVGRARGIYVSDGLEEASLLMALNFVFTGGEHNGSTLSVLGQNPVFDEYREMSIVGGSGVFRLARGIATAKTHWFNMTSGDAVVEYNVVVLHYQ